MANNEEMQTYIANQARREELRISIARLVGSIDATASASQRLNSLNSDAQMILAGKQTELAALEAGAGPGVTADFGPKSGITQMIETERFAAKDAVVDYVKANPECSEEDAAEQWKAAALASHPGFPLVLQDGLVMSALYRSNLLKAGLIVEDTWAAHRQWILANAKAVIESL